MTKKVSLDGDGEGVGKIMLEKHKKQIKMPPITTSRPTTASNSRSTSRPTTASNSRPNTANNK